MKDKGGIIMGSSLPTIPCKFCGYEGQPIEGDYDSDKNEFTCQECIKRNKLNKAVLHNIKTMLKFIKRVLE